MILNLRSLAYIWFLNQFAYKIIRIMSKLFIMIINYSYNS